MTTFRRTVLRTMSLSLGIALLFLGLGFVSVRAQGGPGQIDSNPLAAISAQLASLIAAVSPSGPATLNTGAVHSFANVFVGCLVANVGTASITYERKMINGDGVVVETHSGSLAAGKSTGSVAPRSGLLRCQFIVSEAASFRGTLIVSEDDRPTLVLEAH